MAVRCHDLLCLQAAYAWYAACKPSHSRCGNVNASAERAESVGMHGLGTHQHDKMTIRLAVMEQDLNRERVTPVSENEIMGACCLSSVFSTYCVLKANHVAILA